MYFGKRTPLYSVKVLAVSFGLIMPLLSFSQSWPFELWHEGKIVLVAGDTLKGMVKYDLKQDIVQYDIPNQRYEAFSARKVLFFEIFDTSVQAYRRFFALPYTFAGSYKTPAFFELLAEGKITLLSREALEYRTYQSPYFVGGYTREVLVNTYYFIEENGDITEFKGNRNELLDRMGRKASDVEKYIKANHLKIDDKYDLVRIVEYYNSLFAS